jgi:hypothetical protein
MERTITGVGMNHGGIVAHGVVGNLTRGAMDMVDVGTMQTGHGMVALKMVGLLDQLWVGGCGLLMMTGMNLVMVVGMQNQELTIVTGLIRLRQPALTGMAIGLLATAAQLVIVRRHSRPGVTWAMVNDVVGVSLAVLIHRSSRPSRESHTMTGSDQCPFGWVVKATPSQWST